MASNQPPDVWSQMNYVPPRGQCNFRQSLLSPKCPCLRFMLHPLKSSSSYECDGCAHHASFHSMENKTEDEIRKRWEQEAKDKAQSEKDANKRPRKRLREIEYTQGGVGGAMARITESSGMVTPDEDTASELADGRTRASTRRTGRKQKTEAVGKFLKGQRPEQVGEDDDYIELD